MATQAELIAAVKAHALANYESGGWDMIVECYEDAELAEEIGDATTEAEAIARVGRTAGLYDEQRTAVQNEAF